MTALSKDFKDSALLYNLQIETRIKEFEQMHVDEIKNLKNSTNQLNELQHQFLKIDESVKLHATEISTLAKLSNLKNEQIVYIKAHQDTLKAELW